MTKTLLNKEDVVRMQKYFLQHTGKSIRQHSKDELGIMVCNILSMYNELNENHRKAGQIWVRTKRQRDWFLTLARKLKEETNT